MTLLEILIGMGLLLLAASFTGYKLYGSIGKKRFASEVEMVEARLSICRKMSTAMQADWKGVLQKNGSVWTLETVCLDAPDKKILKDIKLFCVADIFLDQRKVERLDFHFFSGGLFKPQTEIIIHSKDRSEKRTVKLL